MELKLDWDDIAEAKADVGAVKAVNALSDYANNFGTSDKHFAVLLSQEHRTLQQSMTRMMIAWLYMLRDLDDARLTDGRNQLAAKAARTMVEALEKSDYHGLPLI